MTVNAPESGIIKEFLAKEEDTVTVGQDLVKLEPSTEKPAAEKDKKQQDTSQQESTTSKPEQEKSQEATKTREEQRQEPVEEPKRQEKKVSATEKAISKDDTHPAASVAQAPAGTREERRVC